MSPVPCYDIYRLKIIAHGIKSLPQAKDAIRAGVDFLEIDVSKRFFFNKFCAQHNGLMGIIGIGPILETLLTAEVKSRAFLDLKPVSLRNSFTHKFAELLTKTGVKNARICGHNWELISALCKKTGASPFYTLKNKGGLEKFKRQLHLLKKPAGLSVHYRLITKDLINYCSKLKAENFSRSLPRELARGSKNKKALSFEIWAWTVNDLKEAKRLAHLKVDGIITDEWGKLLKSGSSF